MAKKATPKKKVAAKKAAPKKKAAAKKKAAPKKKAAAKKAAPKKKAAAKKAAPKKKAAAKKAAPKKKAAAKKAAPKKKAAAKKAAPKKKAKVAKKKSNRKPNAAFMAPLTPSATLADVIGSKAIPRTEIVKQIWNYIKKNGLQDKKNKRMINADAKLKALFGGKAQISMFELAKIVSKHVS